MMMIIIIIIRKYDMVIFKCLDCQDWVFIVVNILSCILIIICIFFSVCTIGSADGCLCQDGVGGSTNYCTDTHNFDFCTGDGNCMLNMDGQYNT